MKGTTLRSQYHAVLQRMASPTTVKPGGENLVGQPPQKVTPMNRTDEDGKVWRLFQPGLDASDGPADDDDVWVA